MKRILCVGMIVPALCAAGLAQANQGERSEFREQQKSLRQAHRQQARAENERFRDTLKEMDPAQRTAAIRSHRQEQYTKAAAFREDSYRKRREHLTEKLSANAGMPQEEKERVLAHHDAQYAENKAYFERLHAESAAKFDALSADTSLTDSQRREQMKSFRREQKRKTEAYFSQQRQENKALRESFRPVSS